MHFGESWVVEDLKANGEVERRFAYASEEKARFVYLRKVALRGPGAIQAMIFGVAIDGVGAAPLLDFDASPAEPIFEIAPMTWHRAIMGLYPVTIRLGEVPQDGVPSGPNGQRPSDRDPQRVLR